MAKLRKIGCFTETKEKVTLTFGGWDGKSYNGEPCTMNVWKVEGSDDKFVCTYWRKNGGLYIMHKVFEDKPHEKSGYPTCRCWADFEKEMMQAI